jgi:hypothetical protein
VIDRKIAIVLQRPPLPQATPELLRSLPMATKTSNSKPPPSRPLLSHEELVRHVRHVLTQTPSQTATELKRAAPKAQQDAALAVARELALKNEAHRRIIGKTETFFRADPFATLDRLIPALLENQPLSPAELRRRVEQIVRGHGALVSEWLKAAVARGALFEQSPHTPGDRTKMYGASPDLRLMLKRSLAALEAELGKADAASISRASVLEFIAHRLDAAPERRSRGSRQGSTRAFDARGGESTS